jgi:hypothetical protein
VAAVSAALVGFASARGTALMKGASEEDEEDEDDDAACGVGRPVAGGMMLTSPEVAMGCGSGWLLAWPSASIWAPAGS